MGKNNPECHLTEVIWDMFRHYFLYIGKLKDWAFLRAGGTQAKQFAKCGQNGLCMLAAISKTPNLSIFQYRKSSHRAEKVECPTLHTYVEV